MRRKLLLLLVLPLVLGYTLTVPLGRECVEETLPPTGFGTLHVTVHKGVLTVSSAEGTYIVEDESIVRIARNETVTLRLCGKLATATLEPGDSPIISVRWWTGPLYAGQDVNVYFSIENNGSAPGRVIPLLEAKPLAERTPPAGWDIDPNRKYVMTLTATVGDFNGLISLSPACVQYATPWGLRKSCGDPIPTSIQKTPKIKCICLGSDCYIYRGDRLVNTPVSDEFYPNTPINGKISECEARAIEITQIYPHSKELFKRSAAENAQFLGLILLSIFGLAPIAGRVKKG